MSSIKLKVGKPEDGASFYAVNLHFADPEVLHPGERVFDIFLQSDIAAKSLDLAKESPGRLNPMVKCFQRVKVTDSILIELKPVKGETVISGIEIIEE